MAMCGLKGKEPSCCNSEESGVCNVRSRALRDAAILIAWLKIASVFFYFGLLVLTRTYSKGPWSYRIQVVLFLVLPLQIAAAVLLFMGVIEKKILALTIAMWLVLFTALYNTLLGLVGAIYFIRIGFELAHFIIAVIYGVLLLSMFSVLCHDIVVIHALKTLLESRIPPSDYSCETGDDTCSTQKVLSDSSFGGTYSSCQPPPCQPTPCQPPPCQPPPCQPSPCIPPPCKPPPCQIAPCVPPPCSYPPSPPCLPSALASRQPRKPRSPYVTVCPPPCVSFN